MLRSLRLLLLPFSWLFGAVVCLRNAWYASGKRSWRAPVPTLVVGNLSTGGTGKTPHALWVAEILLQHGKHPAMLSRGYGRTVPGFAEVQWGSSSQAVGDEPLLMKRRFPELPVFVCESRVQGIQKLLASHPQVHYVVLDDAFQHRALQPQVALVLLTYESLQKPWFLLPAGDGREPLSALKRAQAVIVSKCPSTLSDADKKAVLDKLRRHTTMPVFFSTYRYLGLVHAQGHTYPEHAQPQKAVLLAGIARPQPLAQWLETCFGQVELMAFADHHPFTRAELEHVLRRAGERPVVTTEKDSMRIHDVWPEFLDHPNVWIAPIVPDLGTDAKRFEHFLLTALDSGKRNG